MRINVYNEELTERIEFVKKKAKTGTPFYGLSFYLTSPEVLHHDVSDDDTSAVVFWSDSCEKLLSLLSKAIEQIKKHQET